MEPPPLIHIQSNIFQQFGKSENNLLWSQYEQWTCPIDNRDTSAHYDPRVHGFKGLLKTSLPGIINPSIDKGVLQASRQLKGDFTFNLDMNSGSPLGRG